MISLRRVGGMRPPQFNERLEIDDDGTFRLWRSVGKASDPPTPVGRFAGQLPDDQLHALREAATAAAGQGSQTSLISPDSPVDTISAGGATATLGIYDSGEGAWQDLAKLTRSLLGTLTDEPLSAVGLHGDKRPALVHLGVEPLRLDLSDLVVRAVHWRDSESLARWVAPDIGMGKLEAGPDWRLDLPFDHGFDLQPGDRAVTYATFAAQDGDEFVPVSLQTQ